MAPTNSNQPQSAKTKRCASQKKQRGVILLMVVSLLALFVLIGVTYSVLALNYHRATELPLRTDEYGDLPEKEFDLILGQLIYDTFARSALRHQSFLADLYGGDLVNDTSVDFNITTGTIGSNPFDNTDVLSTASPNGFIWGGQAFAFQVDARALQSVNTPDYGPGPLSPILDYYSGRLLTFTDGPARNYTGRIMQYDPTAAGGPQFIIELDHSSYGAFGAPVVGSHFFINGAPFNGAGAGYDFTTYNMDAVYGDSRSYLPGTPYPGDLAALLPHFNGFDPTNGAIYMNAGTAAGVPIDNALAAGADEPWEAVDFQNMFLAMIMPTAAALNSDASTGNNVPIIPSFHRPELVNYWVNYIVQNIMVGQAGLDATNDAALIAQIMAQPYGADGVRGPNPPPGGPNDDPLSSGMTYEMLDRVYSLTHGSIFRPMPWDHPNFTGSNANLTGNFDVNQNILNAQQLFNVLRGYDPTGTTANMNLYDVDNDNDGVPDSIWIDPGLPVVTAKDGRRYKRLVAILVQDLDGRIQMNPHGNLHQVTQVEQPPGSGNFIYPFRPEFPLQGGLMTTSAVVPRGVGFGPAEVDFLNIISATPGSPTTNEYTLYESLLTARYTSNYGVDGLPGLPGVRDGLNSVKHHGVPDNYAAQLSWYASPPDVWGRGAVVLDYGGQPVAAFMGSPAEMLNNPYEISLSGEQNGTDSPYALVEIERLLRYHDPDAQRLPCRPLLIDFNLGTGLLNAYTTGVAQPTPGVIGPDHARRQRLAGVGSHIPVPASQIPPQIRETLYTTFSKTPGNTTIMDMYAARFAGAGLSGAALNQAMNQIVPWEIRHGGKLDINRWLGDGFDSTALPGDLTADDPLEGFAGEPAWSADNSTVARGPTPLAPTGFAGTTAQNSNGIDVNMDNTLDGIDRLLARQLYTRHLYCLALMFIDPGYDPLTPHDPTVSGAMQGNLRRELYARRIAQWAINVVDARDSDAIMTPFEYDINPWNGWQADSSLATDGNTAPERIYNPVTDTIDDVTTGERRLVWGVEHPELMLTETFAFHSRNVRDTAFDAADMQERSDGDPEVDQLRIPQGSLYFELYCTRARAFAGQTANQKSRYPAELYDINGRLQLGRVAPGGWPVWRVAISELSNQGSNTNLPDERKPNNIVNATNQARETATFEPTVPAAIGTEPPRDVNVLTGYGAAPPQITGTVPLERFVWFTTPAQASGVAASALNNYSFYSNSNANPLVEPGQYAIVGPRLLTYIGSRDPALSTSDPPPQPASLWGGWSPQRLEMNAGGMTIFNTTLPLGVSTTPVVGTAIRNAVPIVADMNVMNPAVTPPPVGPNGAWTEPLRWNIGLNITEPLPQSGNYYNEPPDLTPYPMNYPKDAYTDLDAPAQELPPPLDNSNNRPLEQHNMIATQTYTDVASIYLQRLANPNVTWNALSNPYITVDWASVDVSVFAGEENTNRQVMVNGMPEDVDLSDPTMGRPQMKWATRQRGVALPAPLDTNPWRPVTNDPPDTGNVNSAPGELYFDVSLTNARHSFPYLNPAIGTPNNTPQYLGEPNANPNTFPWLAHMNRPLASPIELLLVSSSSPSRLCYEFTPGDLSGFQAPNVYDAATPQSLRSPFAHLLNFFHNDGDGSESAQLQRLLDYVEVPSPYAGVERWFNPVNFSSLPTASPYLFPRFYPPFNKLSRFRDPGRININTIVDEEVWYAAISQFPGMNTAGFGELVFRSRQGYGGVGSLLTQDPAYPTLFANPFRALDAGGLMPNVPPTGPGSMRRDGVGGSGGHRLPIDGTFLRSNPDTSAPNQTSLFDRTSGAVHDHTGRNAYFRYQAYQKLGNTFTTHSNVFAVWMTVGYFEVTDTNQPPNAAHPDGLMLGPEIGADSGEIVRHRFFSIVDRSVPVGFAHGQKLNTDNCVLLRRVIE